MSLHKQAQEHGITPSSKEENKAIFRTLLEIGKSDQQLHVKREQGRQAANRLVEGNMGYVVSKVECFLDEHTDYAFLKDDLISEGFLTLARVADNIVTRVKEAPEEDFNPQAMISVSLRNAFLNMIRLEREVPLTDAMAKNLVYDERDVRDLKLDILEYGDNDTEREIVRLRCEGFVDCEIGQMLGVTPRHVRRTRQAIYERFQEGYFEEDPRIRKDL